MKRVFVVLSLFAALMVLPSHSPSQDGKDKKDAKQDKKAASVWMKAKMGFSQEILRGLTEGDFEKIRTNATGLNVVHFFEGFVPKKSEAYRQQVTAFNLANKELIHQSQEKNLYGATLAYNQLTVTCVQCHVIIRDGKK